MAVAVVHHRSLLGLFTSVRACRSGMRSFLLSSAAALTAAAYLQLHTHIYRLNTHPCWNVQFAAFVSALNAKFWESKMSKTL